MVMIKVTISCQAGDARGKDVGYGKDYDPD